MILATHGIIGSSIGGFDADYQAILDYATTQSYTLPSASQQILQNQLVLDLKAGGIWSKLDTFGVFATDAEDSPGSGTSNFALIDWIRLSQYSAINSPTFIPNEGFQGNGTSSYLNSNYNPATSAVNYLLNDASFGVYLLQNSNGNYCHLGAFTSDVSQRIQLVINRFANLTRVNDGGGFFPLTSITSTGLIFANRTDSLTTNIYRNNTLQETKTEISGSIPNLNVHVLAWNFDGTPGFYTVDKTSMAYMGANLTSQASDFSAAINSYMTSI
jgi:hypothetical protein